MITELNKRRYNVDDLGLIDDEYYENIFSVYKIDRHYVYNILRKVSLPSTNLNQQYFSNTIIEASVPWTTISYKVYGTIKLWWLLCAVNGVINPVINIEAGETLRVLKPEYISTVLSTIYSQTQ